MSQPSHNLASPGSWAPAPAAPGSNLVARFEERRRDTMQLLEAFSAADCHDEARFAELLHRLHKFAGVAGLFGERVLGELAARAELELREAAPAERAERVMALKSAVRVQGAV